MGNSIKIGDGNKELDIEQVSEGTENNDITIGNKNNDVKLKHDSSTTEKSKVLENVIYATISIVIALLANYLIGTMIIEYKDDTSIIKGSGSFAIFIFTFFMLKSMSK